MKMTRRNDPYLLLLLLLTRNREIDERSHTFVLCLYYEIHFSKTFLTSAITVDQSND